MSSLQFKCKPEPDIPPADMSDADLMVYITRLQNAGEDCRDQLAELKNALELQDGIIVTDTIVSEQKEPKRWWER